MQPEQIKESSELRIEACDRQLYCWLAREKKGDPEWTRELCRREVIRAATMKSEIEMRLGGCY